MIDVRALGASLRRWGEWGPDDEKGALNYIDDRARLEAARTVQRGAVFSLALTIRNGDGPVRPGSHRFNPVHVVVATGEDPQAHAVPGGASYTDDTIYMPLQCTTQWDALCHVYYDGALYNGYPPDSVTADGAARDGIDKVHADFVGRGVLLDVARHLGVTSLPPGHAITAAELDDCAASQQTALQPGDILLIRTGLMALTNRGEDWSSFDGEQPGLHVEVATWLRDRRVAAVAADNGMVEATHVVEGMHIPLHMIALRDLGIHFGEYWYLEDLAGDCARDRRYAFLLVAPAMPVAGATGSPVNPIAIK
ncbi:MAG TPA: cyclase family protein [Candidatus Dormibacteraeota bacterium]|jgi:kynurenine formamidase|nr:cyclase family protein [Candidatus Dormibacteraeota bacterium]